MTHGLTGLISSLSKVLFKTEAVESKEPLAYGHIKLHRENSRKNEICFLVNLVLVCIFNLCWYAYFVEDVWNEM